MRASSHRYVILIGLDVQDDARYAQYRAAMLPILTEYGGKFEYDFVVGQVLRSQVDAPINRVFTISFPNKDARGRFFSDERYRAVRVEHFEPAVGQAITIAEYQAN